MWFFFRRLQPPTQNQHFPADTVTGLRLNLARGRWNDPSRKDNVSMKTLDLEEMKDAFNQSSDAVRILAILSPT